MRACLTTRLDWNRFRSESQALAALSHPNIVSVLTIGKDGELGYLVMEYVDGSSLVDRLRSARPALAECGQIIREVACGLAAAHAKGIVHGDLVPRNILVSRDLSVVKIVDFGTEVQSTGAPSEGTVTSARLGALLYRAPEVLLSQGGADTRSDIYSLGVIAYEMLTGRIPVGKFNLPSANAFLADLDKVRDVADYQVISELKQLTGRRGKRSPTELFTEKRSTPPSAAPPAPVPSTAPPVATTLPPAPPPRAATNAPPAPSPRTTVRTPAAVAETKEGASSPGTSEPATKLRDPEPLPTPLPTPDLESAAAALFNEAQAQINKNNDGARRRLAAIGASYAESSWFVPAMTAKINLEDRGRLREFDTVAGVRVPASLLTRRLLIERAPKHPTSEAALWWLGETYEDLKLYQLAADAWFKAGEIYERRLNNRAAARAAYLKVPSVSRRYKDAQNRSQRIDR